MPTAIRSKTTKKILVLLLITDYTGESDKDSEEPSQVGCACIFLCEEKRLTDRLKTVSLNNYAVQR